MNVQPSHVNFWKAKPVNNPATFFTQPALHPYLREPNHAFNSYLFVNCLTARIKFSSDAVMVFGVVSAGNSKRQRFT